MRIGFREFLLILFVVLALFQPWAMRRSRKRKGQITDARDEDLEVLDDPTPRKQPPHGPAKR